MQVFVFIEYLFLFLKKSYSGDFRLYLKDFSNKIS